MVFLPTLSFSFINVTLILNDISSGSSPCVPGSTPSWEQKLLLGELHCEFRELAACWPWTSHLSPTAPPGGAALLRLSLPASSRSALTGFWLGPKQQDRDGTKYVSSFPLQCEEGRRWGYFYLLFSILPSFTLLDVTPSSWLGSKHQLTN